MAANKRRGRAIRVVLIEPQTLVVQGIRRELSASDIEVVGVARDAEQGIELIHNEAPDIAVVAVQLPDRSGLNVLEAIGDGVPMLMLTTEESPEIIFQAMMQGARGYLLKLYADVNLEEAVRAVLRGELVMGPHSLKLFIGAVKRRMRVGANTRHQKGLSPREREVLVHVSQGMSQSRIAQQLGLSPATVRTHIRNAYMKLGVTNQATAIAEAMRQGLIDHSPKRSLGSQT